MLNIPQKLFSYLFNGEFHNLLPAELYADYIRYSDLVVTGKDGDNLVLCAPDHGADVDQRHKPRQ